MEILKNVNRKYVEIAVVSIVLIACFGAGLLINDQTSGRILRNQIQDLKIENGTMAGELEFERAKYQACNDELYSLELVKDDIETQLIASQLQIEMIKMQVESMDQQRVAQNTGGGMDDWITLLGFFI